MDSFYFFLESVVEGVFGWRYLVSPSYRMKMQERWQEKGQLSRVAEAGMMILSFICLNALVVLLIWVLLDIVFPSS